jgi:hypothetical protein
MATATDLTIRKTIEMLYGDGSFPNRRNRYRALECGRGFRPRFCYSRKILSSPFWEVLS